jgi:uncharacterized membrane protein
MPNFISISNDVKHDAERWTGRVLRIGVWVSASLMIAGLLVGAIYPSTIVAFSSNPTLGDLLLRLLVGSFDPVTLMFAGLVFTPILRVITAIVGFGVERDWRFVFVSAVVLLLLTGEIVYSIFIKG